jgi:cell division cycle 14
VQILVQNYSVEQAYGPFIGIEPAFITFRDAGFCINTFPITVLDIARGIKRAKSLGHINYKTFSVQNYQTLGKLQNGDISWIVPGKFIAFSGPIAK